MDAVRRDARTADEVRISLRLQLTSIRAELRRGVVPAAPATAATPLDCPLGTTPRSSANASLGMLSSSDRVRSASPARPGASTSSAASPTTPARSSSVSRPRPPRLVAAQVTTDGLVTAVSGTPEAVLAIDELIEPRPSKPSRAASRGADGWAAYVLGPVAMLLRELGAPPAGIRVLVSSYGARGRRGSARPRPSPWQRSARCRRALGRDEPIERLVLLAQRAEHVVAGAPCGVMDQVTAARGEAGAAPRHPLSAGSGRGIARAPGAAHRLGHRLGRDPRRVRPGLPARPLCVVHGEAAARPARATSPRSSRRRSTASSLPSVMAGREFLELHGDVDDPFTAVEPDVAYPVRAATLHPIEEHLRVRLFAELIATPVTDRARPPARRADVPVECELRALRHRDSPDGGDRLGSPAGRLGARARRCAGERRRRRRNGRRARPARRRAGRRPDRGGARRGIRRRLLGRRREPSASGSSCRRSQRLNPRRATSQSRSRSASTTAGSAERPVITRSTPSIGQSFATSTRPSLLPSASTTLRVATASIRCLSAASGRLMFVTPPIGSTPLQPSSTVLTEIWSRMSVASGSTSECCNGRSVPPSTTTVIRGSRRLELERGLQPVREDDHVAELRPRRDRARSCRRRRPDVDDHRLAVLQQRGRGLGDRHLLRREARDAVLERLLLRAVSTAGSHHRGRGAPCPWRRASPGRRAPSPPRPRNGCSARRRARTRAP